MKTDSGLGSRLSADEARRIIDEIRDHLESARNLLYQLYTGEGWLALGYESWRQCVMNEFGRSESQLYRELSAAKVEAMIGLPIGSLPESHIRAVREIYQDEVDTMAVVEEAMAECHSADEFRSYAASRWVEDNIGKTKIAKRLEQGLIGPVVAYRLGAIYQTAHVDVKPFVEVCSDSRVAHRITLIHAVRKDLWEDIATTGSIPLYENVPLADATIRDVEAWLGIDNSERRAQHVERNSDHYKEMRELGKELESEALNLAMLAKPYDKLALAAEAVIDVLDRMRLLKESLNEARK